MKSIGSSSIVIATIAAFALTVSGCDAFLSSHQLVGRAHADLAKGDWSRAAIDLRKAVQKDPKDANAWLALARLSLDAADPSDAAVDLGKALKFGARGVEVDTLQARTWLATGQAPALIQAITAKRLALAEPARSVFLAKAYNQVHQPAQALAALATSLARRPIPTDVALAAAVALGEQGESGQALARIRAAMAADPQSYEPPLLEGQVLAARGDTADARTAFERALQRMPAATPLSKRAEALAGLSEAALALGDVSGASKASATLSQVLPAAPIAQLLAARIKLVRGDRLDGIADLERLVANVPSYVNARLLLGAAQFDRVDVEQAQENVDEVLRQAPSNLAARELLARIRLKLHQPQQALDVLAPAVTNQPMTPELYALLGAAGRAAGKPDAALTAIEQAAHAHPKDLALQLNLAQAYLGAHRPTDALALLDKTDPSGENPRRDALWLAATGAVKGESAVRGSVEQLLKAHPTDPGVIDLAANYYASRRQFDQARTLVEHALARAPRNGPLLVMLARIDLAAGQLAPANAALDRLIATQPQNAALVNAVGLLLMQANQYQAALTRFRAAIGIDRSKAMYWFDAGRAQLALNQAGAARESFREATKLAPTWVAPVGALAFIDLQQKDSQRAVARADALIAKNPKNPDALALKGQIESSIGQYVAADASYTAAERLQPSSALAVRLFMVRRAERAAHPEAVLEQWLTQHPDDAAVRTELGMYQLSTNDLPGAAKSFETVMQTAPNDVIALNNLAWIYAKQHDPRAEAVAQRAYQLAPGQPAVADTLGWILVQGHHLQKALPFLASAAKANGAGPDVQYHYAYALAEAGEKTEARAILLRLLANKAPFAARQQATALLARLQS